MYRLSDILHPLNVIGRKPTPMIPPPAAHVPADETVLMFGTYRPFRFYPYYSGTLTITYTQGGVQQSLMLPPEDSGNIVAISPDDYTDVVFSGNLTKIDPWAGADGISIGSTITDIDFKSGYKTIDMRNAADANTIGYNHAYYVNKFYAKAKTPVQKDMCLVVISDKYGNVNGTIWVNIYDAYSREVIAAALSAGWNVNKYAQ